LSDPPATRLACVACGAPAPGPFTGRCPDSGRDDLDHHMTRTLDVARVGFPHDNEADPFVRFRRLTHAWQVGTAAGMSDADFVARVRRLEDGIAAADGRGFGRTPCTRMPALAARLGLTTGTLWVKDETGNVSGSHKGRHLMGLAIALDVMEALDPATRAAHERHGLAIASCGNAALAAAVVARASRRRLTAFIPEDAEPRVVARLESLGAGTEVCPRQSGTSGDPTMHAFRRAVAAGALPFCCQGSENGLTVEGGETLAWELVTTLAGGGPLDRLFVQVGGGALISACVAGLREAVALGALARLPRIHAVQSQGCFPLARAYARVRERILAAPGPGGRAVPAAGAGSDAEQAGIMQRMDHGPDVARALEYAIRHRSEFMSPWEVTPRSIAHGILDDETYDWHLPVAGMIESGGFPVVVGEDMLREATGLALETTGIAVDATGAAGLAGALALARQGGIAGDEKVAVLFTGARR
jgi:threonine synthase